MKTTVEQEARLKSFSELSKFLGDIGAVYDDIWLRFWDFRLTHPDVEERLVHLARTAKKRNFAKYGYCRAVGGLALACGDRGWEEEFKMSNDYRSRYARYLMWKCEDLNDFFDLRPLRTGVAA